MEEQFECRICGKPAIHYHYKVRSCSGCKSFYQRALTKHAHYTCFFGGNCSMRSSDLKFNRCKACRYRIYSQLIDASFRGYNENPNPGTLPEHGLDKDLVLQRERLYRPANHAVQVYSPIARDKWITSRYYDENVPYALAVLRISVAEIFDDELRCWTFYRKFPPIEDTIDMSQQMVDKITNEVDLYNCDFIEKLHSFAKMLVGFASLDFYDKSAIWAGWKVIMYYMIHQSPFMTDEESFVTYGKEQIHYNRRWQEYFSSRAMTVFIYRFCTQLRNMHLDETERYLLMAVVMLEPDDSQPCKEPCTLHQLHRFYTNLLLRKIQQRCTENSKMTAVSMLSDFFAAIRHVQHVSQMYASAEPPPTMRRCFARVAEILLEDGKTLTVGSKLDQNVQSDS